jgi:hypothetical protein
MASSRYVRWFSQISYEDVPLFVCPPDPVQEKIAHRGIWSAVNPTLDPGIASSP